MAVERLSELIPLGAAADVVAAFMPEGVSHFAFGAVGGLLYILRQKMKRYKVEPIEWLARPIFGGIAAYVLTVSLGLPNHVTSIFVGGFGVDAWDAISTRFEAAFGRSLPFAFKHVKQSEIDAAIQARVDELKK